MSRFTAITQGARSIGFALREDDVVDGLFEWTLLIAGAETDFNYLIESDYEDPDDARLVAYLMTPVVDHLMWNRAAGHSSDGARPRRQR